MCGRAQTTKICTKTTKYTLVRAAHPQHANTKQAASPATRGYLLLEFSSLLWKILHWATRLSLSAKVSNTVLHSYSRFPCKVGIS